MIITNLIKLLIKTICYEFFKKSFKCANQTKKFRIPSWIPFFPPPEKEFNRNPPTYNEVSQIIKRTKTSGPPCPLDQISIIWYKRCPYLRSYLTALIAEIWKKNVIPLTWKKAITILIYKKGSTDSLSNFRPIILETVTLKILTSALRNKVCQFLFSNNYIETNIQKGFVNGTSSIFEHTSHLAYVINNARKSQRSLIVTLLDLGNAFGEVYHNSIVFWNTIMFQRIFEKVLKICFVVLKSLCWLMAFLLTSYIWKKVFYKGIVSGH